jgi:hypothetical protein
MSIRDVRIPRVHIRAASPTDARGIAAVHVASWRTTYRGIVPADYLAGLSADAREHSWRRQLASYAARSSAWRSGVGSLVSGPS